MYWLTVIVRSVTRRIGQTGARIRFLPWIIPTDVSLHEIQCENTIEERSHDFSLLAFAFLPIIQVRFSTGLLRRVFRSARPSGQSPRPLALLICPAPPIITNSLPHFFANVCAREGVTYGSLELATTILRNRSRSIGIGAKPLGPDGKLGASGSLGATRSAPRMRFEESPTAQRAISAHPALCATSTVSGPVSESA